MPALTLVKSLRTEYHSSNQRTEILVSMTNERRVFRPESSVYRLYKSEGGGGAAYRVFTPESSCSVEVRMPATTQPGYNSLNNGQQTEQVMHYK